MSIKFRCSGCRSKVAAPDELAGSDVVCPNPGCGRCLNVPNPVLRNGDQVGSYVIDHMIGSGNMGEVHLAKHQMMNRIVALKYIPDNNLEDPEARKRFQREAAHLAKLNHPGFVQALDAGRHGAGQFLAMNLIDGGTAEDALERNGPFKEDRLIELAKNAAEALCFAWEEHSLLHRDIKPANIMIDGEGRFVLADMGIAKDMSDDIHLTALGTVMGTPYYMSPEQAMGERELDQRSDIYSLGATLYNLAAGKPPYDGMEPMQVMATKLRRDPKSLAEHRSDLSSSFIKLIQDMMAIDPAKRLRDWQEVIKRVDTLKKRADTSKIAKMSPAGAPNPAKIQLHAPANRPRQPQPEKKSGCLGLLLAGALLLPAAGYGLYRLVL